jgi:hypothetical protein
MDKFLKYFENQKFVRWVLKPDQKLDDYWKEYIKSNSSEKEQIELARLLILQLRSKKEHNTETEAIELFSEIMQKLGTRNKKTVIRRIGLTVLKYAVVGLLFFSLGIVFYYYQKPSQFDGLTEQLAVDHDQNNVQLILGNGRNVSIAKKESNVEYQNNGRIVINKQDTVRAVPKSRKQELNQLLVPYGKNSSIKLPDGTIAYLNAGSRLVYPSFFEGKKREVFLFGEGFFEVIHNADMPFIVKTKELEVEVLGTKFNLSDYPSDKIIETVLVEGKVIIKESGFHFMKSEYILEPNQRAAFNRESAEMKVTQVDVLNYISWHDGYMNFEASDLNRIVKKLERYYNVQIRLDNPILGMRAITGKLKLREDKESVLKVLANTASAELIKLNETMYIMK